MAPRYVSATRSSSASNKSNGSKGSSSSPTTPRSVAATAATTKTTNSSATDNPSNGPPPGGPRRTSAASLAKQSRHASGRRPRTTESTEAVTRSHTAPSRKSTRYAYYYRGSAAEPEGDHVNS